LFSKGGYSKPNLQRILFKRRSKKALELNITDVNKIKEALEPEPTTIVIDADQTRTTLKTYKDSIGPNVPRPTNYLNFNNFKKIQRLLFKVHTSQTQTILNKVVDVNMRCQIMLNKVVIFFLFS